MPDNRVSTEVSETKNYSTLKIKYDCGLNGEGKTIVKSRSYSNVKANAKALDVFNVAETLVSLQQHDKLSIIKLDNTELN
ncbi:MAG: DUF1659 domain-containing protein [Paraclostridium sordellii]